MSRLLHRPGRCGDVREFCATTTTCEPATHSKHASNGTEFMGSMAWTEVRPAHRPNARSDATRGRMFFAHPADLYSGHAMPCQRPTLALDIPRGGLGAAMKGFRKTRIGPPFQQLNVFRQVFPAHRIDLPLTKHRRRAWLQLRRETGCSLTRCPYLHYRKEM